MADPHAPRRVRSKLRTFRRVVLRGLTILLPPILTIVILVWVVNTIDAYVLQPLTVVARDVLVWEITDVQDDPPGASADQRDVRIGRSAVFPAG